MKGQSLIEIIIGLAIGTMLIGAGAAAINLILKSNLDSRSIQIADGLAVEYLNNLKPISESSWISIYNPPAGKGVNSQFYLAASGTSYVILSGATSTNIEGRLFTRYFSIENVNRQKCGIGDISEQATTTSCLTGFPGSSADIAEDPSTQKITVTVKGEGGRKLVKTQYLTRSRNLIFKQTDWSGGANQEGPITLPNDKFATSTDIDYATTSGAIKIQGF